MTATPIQVLLVEDNPGDARLVREYLAGAGGASFKIENVLTLATALERCSRPGIDVVLLDLGLPDSVGLDTFKAFRSRAPELPVVVCTGLDDEKLAVQVVQAGAQDYLIKGESGGALTARALRYAIERKRAEVSLRESEKRYRTLFEDAQDGMALADVETGQLVDCNNALCHMVERDKAELVGQAQAIIHPPKTDTAKLTQTFRQHQTGVPGQVLEDCLLSKSGKLVPVEICAARIRMNGRNYLLNGTASRIETRSVFFIYHALS